MIDNDDDFREFAPGYSTSGPMRCIEVDCHAPGCSYVNLVYVEDQTVEIKRLRSILGHLCVDPDLVGRSCGECLPCQLVAAAKRDAAASDEKGRRDA